MIELRNENLRSIRSDIRLPDYDRSQLRPGIVHLGVGNFHRVHQATAIEECLCVPGNEYWAISGVGLTNAPTARQKTAAYRLQDNLYTVTELKSDMSMVTRVVGAMAEYLHAPENPQRVLDRLTDPTTRIVSLTITEGGYNLGLIVSLVPNYSFLGFETCLFTGLVLGLTNGALIAFL